MIHSRSELCNKTIFGKQVLFVIEGDFCFYLPSLDKQNYFKIESVYPHWTARISEKICVKISLKTILKNSEKWIEWSGIEDSVFTWHSGYSSLRKMLEGKNSLLPENT